MGKKGKLNAAKGSSAKSEGENTITEDDMAAINLLANDKTISKKRAVKIITQLMQRATQVISDKERLTHQLESLSTSSVALDTEKEVITNELEKVRAVYLKARSKTEKLEILQQQLLNRLKETEAKHNANLFAEQDRRRQLSEGYGDSIKALSKRLDQMNESRIESIKKNIELREALGKCIEEFEELEKLSAAFEKQNSLDENKQSLDEATSVQKATKDDKVKSDSIHGSTDCPEVDSHAISATNDPYSEESVNSAEKSSESNEDSSSSTSQPDIAAPESDNTSNKSENLPVPPSEDNANSKKESVPSEEASVDPAGPTEEEEAELREMEAQDMLPKIYILSTEELMLKTKSQKYLELFDAFQTQLRTTNELFRSKQLKIDQLSIEMKTLELDNNKLLQKIKDCRASTERILLNNSGPLRPLLQRKEKLTKSIAQYKKMIDTFQKDIAELQHANLINDNEKPSTSSL